MQTGVELNEIYVKKDTNNTKRKRSPVISAHIDIPFTDRIGAKYILKCQKVNMKLQFQSRCRWSNVVESININLQTELCKIGRTQING